MQLSKSGASLPEEEGRELIRHCIDPEHTKKRATVGMAIKRVIEQAEAESQWYLRGGFFCLTTNG